MGRRLKREGINRNRNPPVAQMVKNLLAMQETQVQSLGQERSLGEGNGYKRLSDQTRIKLENCIEINNYMTFPQWYR